MFWYKKEQNQPISCGTLSQKILSFFPYSTDDGSIVKNSGFIDWTVSASWQIPCTVTTHQEVFSKQNDVSPIDHYWSLLSYTHYGLKQRRNNLKESLLLALLTGCMYATNSKFMVSIAYRYLHQCGTNINICVNVNRKKNCRLFHFYLQEQTLIGIQETKSITQKIFIRKSEEFLHLTEKNVD